LASERINNSVTNCFRLFQISSWWSVNSESMNMCGSSAMWTFFKYFNFQIMNRQAITVFFLDKFTAWSGWILVHLTAYIVQKKQEIRIECCNISVKATANSSSLNDDTLRHECIFPRCEAWKLKQWTAVTSQELELVPL